MLPFMPALSPIQTCIFSLLIHESASPISINIAGRKSTISRLKGINFVEKGVKDYEDKIKQTEIYRLAKLAKKHGYVLANAQLHQ